MSSMTIKPIDLPEDKVLIPVEEIRDRVADAVTKALAWGRSARVAVTFSVSYSDKEERATLSTQVKTRQPTKNNVDQITTGDKEEIAAWKNEIPGQQRASFEDGNG